MTAYTKAEERFLLSQNTILPPPVTDTLAFRCNYQNIKLPVSDILYIEAFDNYVKVVTQTKTFMPVMTMKSIMSLLPDSGFIRIHKSFIIPVVRIKSFNNEVVVTDKIHAPIGRTFRKDFLNKMAVLKE